jgi:uncharacterized membrane protein
MAICTSCGAPLSANPKFCPSCGTEQTREGSVAGAGGKPTSANPRRIFFVVTLLVIGLSIFVYYLIPSVHPVIGGQPVVAEAIEYGPNPVTMTTVPFRIDGEDLVFSLDAVKKNRLVRFEYTGGKTPRAIMAYLAPDGRLVTAISISEHCGSTEFEIKDNKIYCARCPSNWDMMTMEAYACCAQYYPAPIESRVVDNEVRIAKATVENWAGRL